MESSISFNVRNLALKVFDKDNYLFEHGIVTYRSTGFVGTEGDALVIAPPFVIEEDDISYLVDAVGRALEKVLG